MAAISIYELEAILKLRDEMSDELNEVDANVKSFSKGSMVQFGFFAAAGEKAFSLVMGAAKQAVGSLVSFGQSAMMAAVEAQESENLFEVSFGGMADSARKWSEETSVALGLNEFELRKQAATLYVMSDSMGVASDQAFEMSTQLTVLAGDMASFYNLPHEDAFAKIQAGISGESEPLKRLGIIVNETTIKHTALEHGIISAGEKMTEAEKVWARYLTIMDQTSKAQGDLARTLQSPANAMRVLTSQFEAFKIHLGQSLMPLLRVFVQVQGQILGYLMDNKQAIIDYVTNGVLKLVDALPLAVKGLGLLNEWFSAIVVTAKSFLAGIMKVVEGIQKANLWYLKLVGTEEDVQRAQENLRKTQVEVAKLDLSIGESTNAYTSRAEAVDQLAAGARRMADEIIESTKNAVEPASVAVEEMGDKMGGTAGNVAAFEKNINDALLACKEFAASQEPVIDIEKQNDQVLQHLTETAKKLKEELGDPPPPPTLWGKEIVETLQDTLSELPNVIIGALQGGGDVFKVIGAQIGADLGGMLAENLAGTLTSALGETLGGTVGSFFGPLGTLAGSAVGGLIDSIFGPSEQEQVNDMRDAFFEAEGGWEAFYEQLASQGLDAEAIIHQIWDAETVDEFNAAIDETRAKMELQTEAQELLQDAIERYGFTLEEMPQKMKQDEIDQGFAQLFQDFELLKAAGFEVNTILARMAPNINDMVQQAVSAGGTVPSAMKPIIDQMIEQGLLVDENGEAYASAEEAGITYAQTMSEMFESLIEKVDELVNALLGINDIDVSPNVHIPTGGGGGGGRPPGGRSYPDAEAQQGFYSPSMPVGPRPGGGTDIRVHPGEEVRVKPRGASGGGGKDEQPLTVVVNIGPEKLYEMITKATKGGQVRVYPDAVKAF